MITENKISFEWESDERPIKKWSKDYYSTVTVLAFLVSVVMYFIEGVMPVIVIWSIVFLMWNLSRVTPVKSKHTFNKWGLALSNDLYRWEEMNRFWFEDKWGSRVLKITVSKIPWLLLVVVNNKEEESQIKSILEKKVVFGAPEPTFFDKVSKWISEKVPLE